MRERRRIDPPVSIQCREHRAQAHAGSSLCGGDLGKQRLARRGIVEAGGADRSRPQISIRFGSLECVPGRSEPAGAAISLTQSVIDSARDSANFNVKTPGHAAIKNREGSCIKDVDASVRSVSLLRLSRSSRHITRFRGQTDRQKQSLVYTILCGVRAGHAEYDKIILAGVLYTQFEVLEVLFLSEQTTFEQSAPAL